MSLSRHQAQAALEEFLEASRTKVAHMLQSADHLSNFDLLSVLLANDFDSVERFILAVLPHDNNQSSLLDGNTILVKATALLELARSRIDSPVRMVIFSDQFNHAEKFMNSRYLVIAKLNRLGSGEILYLKTNDKHMDELHYRYLGAQSFLSLLIDGLFERIYRIEKSESLVNLPALTIDDMTGIQACAYEFCQSPDYADSDLTMMGEEIGRYNFDHAILTQAKYNAQQLSQAKSLAGIRLGDHEREVPLILSHFKHKQQSGFEQLLKAIYDYKLSAFPFDPESHYQLNSKVMNYAHLLLLQSSKKDDFFGTINDEMLERVLLKAVPECSYQVIIANARINALTYKLNQLSTINNPDEREVSEARSSVKLLDEVDVIRLVMRMSRQRNIRFLLDSLNKSSVLGKIFVDHQKSLKKKLEELDIFEKKMFAEDAKCQVPEKLASIIVEAIKNQNQLTELRLLALLKAKSKDEIFTAITFIEVNFRIKILTEIIQPTLDIPVYNALRSFFLKLSNFQKLARDEETGHSLKIKSHLRHLKVNARSVGAADLESKVSESDSRDSKGVLTLAAKAEVVKGTPKATPLQTYSLIQSGVFEPAHVKRNISENNLDHESFGL